MFAVLDSYGQGWQWGKDIYGLGSSKVVSGHEVKVDKCKNIYAAGLWKSDSITIGTVTYYNHNVGINNYECYFIKYDSLGNVLWSSASVLGQAYPYGIVNDDDGNVYLYGCFWTDSVMFGSHLLVNSRYDSCLYPWCAWGTGCYFIIKYDPLGNIIWAKSGDNIMGVGGGIAIDKASNIYISGSYWNAEMHIGMSTFYNPSYKKGEIFIAKYDSSGNVIWAKSFGNTLDDWGGKIAYANDKIYLTGNFLSPTLSIGSSTLSYFSSIPLYSIGAAYIAQFDTAGNCLWARSAAGSAIPMDIAVDSVGGAIIGGQIFDTVFVSFSSDTIRNVHLRYAGFIAKYDVSGSVSWTKGIFNSSTTVAGTGFGTGNKVWTLTTDPCNNIWVSGQISGDTGGIFVDSGVILRSPAGSWDPTYLVGYNSSGMLLQKNSLRSGANNGGKWGIASDRDGYIYVCDEYRDAPIIFNTDTLTHFSATATFLAKYRPFLGCHLANSCSVGDALLQNTQTKKYEVALFPNPANTECTITYNGILSTHAGIAIYDPTGRLMHTYPLTGSSTTISIAHLPPGMYVCKIDADGSGAVSKKLVIMR